MAGAQQPFRADDLQAAQLAILRRQVTHHKELLDYVMSLAEDNYELQDEMARTKQAAQALVEDKEAYREENLAQERDYRLLELEVARLQRSNARLEGDLDAEVAKNEALESELNEAKLDMEEMREDYATNLYDVRKAYTLAQRECILEAKEAEEHRLSLELRLRQLTDVLNHSSKRPAGAEPPQVDHRCSCSREGERSTREDGSSSREDGSAESARRLERQHAAEAELARLAAALHAREGELAAVTQACARLRASRDKVAEDNAQLHAAYASLAKADARTAPAGQPSIPAPAEHVLYEDEPAAAPAAPAAQAAARTPLSSPDNILEAELGSCVQLDPNPQDLREPLRDDSLNALLAEDYIQVSTWADDS